MIIISGAASADSNQSFAFLGNEEGLLAASCRAVIFGREPELAILGGEVDWERLKHLARSHRVEPLVAAALQRRLSIAVPPAATAHFQAAVHRNALWVLGLTGCLLRITAAFNSAGIVSIPLKGIALADRYYGSLALRQAGDLDLLIAPDDLARANQVLKRLNFGQVSSKTHQPVGQFFEENDSFVHHHSFISPEGFPVELHSRLHQNPRLQPTKVAEIVARRARTRLGEVDLPVMPDDMQFTFLATHGARHEWERLQWVCDIAAMVGRASSQEVLDWLRRAREEGLAGPAIQALVIAHETLGVAIPERVSRAYAGSRRARYMVQRARKVMSGKLERKPDGETGLDLPLRLYRMCMSSRPSYFWKEFVRGTRSMRLRRWEVAF